MIIEEIKFSWVQVEDLITKELLKILYFLVSQDKQTPTASGLLSVSGQVLFITFIKSPKDALVCSFSILKFTSHLKNAVKSILVLYFIYFIVIVISLITNFKGSGVVNPGWPCPTCTLVNPSNATMCSACGSKRDSGASHREASQPSPSTSPSKIMKRQKSIPVESRRMRDEKQAKEQWINIVQYCNSVCTNTGLPCSFSH